MYAVTTSTVVLDSLSIKEDTIVVLKSFDELRNDHSVASGFVEEDVATFIMASSTPLVAEFSQVNYVIKCSY